MYKRIFISILATIISCVSFAQNYWLDKVFQETNPFTAEDIISAQSGLSIEGKKSSEIKDGKLTYSASWSFNREGRNLYLAYKNRPETAEISVIIVCDKNATMESLISDFNYCKSITTHKIYLRKLNMDNGAVYTFWIGNDAAHEVQWRESAKVYPHEEFDLINDSTEINKHFGDNPNVNNDPYADVIRSAARNSTEKEDITEFLFDELFQMNDFFKIKMSMDKQKSYVCTYDGIDKQKIGGQRFITIYDSKYSGRKTFLTIEYFPESEGILFTYGCPDGCSLEELEGCYNYCRKQTSRDIYLKQTKFERGMSYAFFIANTSGLQLEKAELENSKMTKMFRIDYVSQLSKYYK